jgi:8-oxo-dGTP diphosphatase
MKGVTDELPPLRVTDRGELVNLRCSVLVFRGETVLLCHRADEGDSWVLPGGTPRLGEGTAAAAQREATEETGLNVTTAGVAFVLETTSRDVSHHLIEIVFLGAEPNAMSQPRQCELGLEPQFVDLDSLGSLELRPPISGYIRGYAKYQRPGNGSRSLFTAAYLGNLWRAADEDDLPSPSQKTPSPSDASPE